MGTMVGCLKGALLLLKNCSAIPTDVMGLLNDVMVLADCGESVEYIKSIYFAAKRNNSDDGYMEYLDIAKAEYRTIYRRGKWIKAGDTSESGFFGDVDGSNRRNYGTGG